MKKHLMMLVALLVALSFAMPVFAAVELKYGGQFRARWHTQDNQDGTDDADDNKNFIDQRLRLYFNFVASENLRLVTKFEIGDTIWGDDKLRTGPGTGGNVGADSVNIETKNAYVEFNIPETPLTASVGIQGINLMDSWIIDDDFSAAVLKAKFDSIRVQAGYIAAQNTDVTDTNDNIDSYYLSIDYAGDVGPGKLTGTLIGYYQNGNNTIVSTDPASGYYTVNNPATQAGNFLFPVGSPFYPIGAPEVDSNDLFDIGVNLGYKMDWMAAYVSFVKNLGSVDFIDGGSADYKGWMVDAGANFFCGPFTFNLGGFYTSGQELDDDSNDIDGFAYPLSTTKYFSEIIGGGILDKFSISHTDVNGKNDLQWTGYGQPSNLWTVTAGASWQALEKTKLSASYWYFGTAEDVESFDGTDNSIGHEIDLYLTQGIVDGLTLDLVGAYLFADDAYTAAESVDDVYEVGARLQWNF
ncbi:hypothetical protein [Desulforhabdus sp. TSK]|uniref:hypothetical protein n=1 Tax=Desulforhabdus sp. TSK TaxID=2925014 RepID=UPI001FC87BE1|nr:hypothetical protein [Desulforhabdus sp. TSK]GKT08678.1 histidine kinase [Desulforhabdus sp. TSK]